MKNYSEFLAEQTTIDESSLSRVSAMMSTHDAGIMTAWRVGEDCGKGKPITRSENESRNRELLATLKSRGYGVTTVRGTWAPPTGKISKEDSYIIIDLKDSGKLERDIVNLGIKYEQDSVIFKPKGERAVLITTNSCDGRIGDRSVAGNPKFGYDGEFRTQVGGRNFVFEEIEK